MAVRDGRPLRKHRHAQTPEDDLALSSSLQIIRRSPGPACQHVLGEDDVRRFLRILPDRRTLCAGLRSIVLDRCTDVDGYYRYDGVITLNAWPKDLFIEYDADHFEAHRGVFARIGVPSEPLPKEDDGRWVRCYFNHSTARAFSLLHVFLHELGHHLDRMTGGPARGRGEDWAESFALRKEQEIWPGYLAHFGRPR